jgi:site-specific recombinase XerC
VWLERVERLARLGQRSPGTVETYSRQLNAHVLPALGALRLLKVTTPLVDRFVTDVHEHVGRGTGRTCRSVVLGVMALAVRQGAVSANPTRELERLSSQPRRVPRAFCLRRSALDRSGLCWVIRSHCGGLVRSVGVFAGDRLADRRGVGSVVARD